MEGVSLMANNAGAPSVYIEDKALAALGGEGEIIENIALGQENLLALSMVH